MLTIESIVWRRDENADYQLILVKRRSVAKNTATEHLNSLVVVVEEEETVCLPCRGCWFER